MSILNLENLNIFSDSENLLQMTSDDRWAKLCFSDKFAMIFGFVISVIVLIFPFIALKVVHRKRSRINECIKSGEKYEADFVEKMFSELFVDLKEL